VSHPTDGRLRDAVDLLSEQSGSGAP
jgi:hypothetical protein